MDFLCNCFDRADYVNMYLSICAVKEKLHVYGRECVCVCCRWLEEPAASGSVRKHLIRDGLEEEREGGRKRKQRGGDEGGVAGWSAEHPSHLFSNVHPPLFPVSFACVLKLSPPLTSPVFIIYSGKRR